MNLCSNGHDEVCFEGRVCPCCYERTELQADVDALKIKIADLEKEMADLERNMDK
jgi:hypothetical protein